MRLTASQARRMALAAQGIGGGRDRLVGMRQVGKVITGLGQFQIDSVNVLARAHLMPLYTRLGAYDPALLTRAATAKPRRLFEFWGHAASLIDIQLYPVFQFRREAAHDLAWGRLRTLVDNQPEVIEEVLEAVGQYGPATARDLDLGEKKYRDHWGWNWSLAKTALEWLFYCGRVAVAGRTAQFERLYDIPERVIPEVYLAACEPWADASPTQREELTHAAHVELIRRSARALGVGTLRCLGDYFRIAAAPARAAVAELVSRSELVPAEVDGVKEPAWVWHEAACPRKIQTAALVSPFDSLVFERKRLARFFHTDYTIGLYTPPDQRVHGYYVYLFLLDDAFAARTDLKADRATSALLVQSAWLEAPAEPNRARVAAELASELRRLADWLNLTNIVVAGKGDLSHDLIAELAKPESTIHSCCISPPRNADGLVPPPRHQPRVRTKETS
uniref:Cytoplasmic protein n=1 Tax=termite gut metagenome TaxID=433724 RepID=S0DGA3_9ZZZZ